jgi:hypothetical protein
MTKFVYPSGEEVKRGDRIRFHGEPGEVEFVVAELTGDPAMDWYMEEFPGGGYMIKAEGFGRVFLMETSNDLEDLEFVARAKE